MRYVRNAWYVACWSHELQVDQPLGVKILSDPIAIWRTEDGNLAALFDRCLHRFAALSRGKCDHDFIRCMYHGILYDSTGQIVEIPGQDVIPEGVRLRSYPVEDRHGWIWVWMGEPDKADVNLIPAATSLDHPDYIMFHGDMTYAAEASLICENLLDFSHLPFVHAQSFGASTTWAFDVPHITANERGVRVQRWLMDTVSVSKLGGQTLEKPVLRYSRYDFIVPGILLMTSGIFPDGTDQTFSDEGPDMSQSLGDVSFTSQAVTPVADGQSRYFYAWGPRRDHGGEDVRDMLREIAIVAFNEDRELIEAQQLIIAGTQQANSMLTKHDKANVLFARLTERLEKTTGSIAARKATVSERVTD